MAELYHGVLAAAARRALAAPSVFNTQPWRWTVRDTLELRADRTRQLAAADASGRMLLVSCGAALHHARVAIAAAGCTCEVTRSVATGTDDVLATVRITDRVMPSPAQSALAAAIEVRRTDRRPFTDELPDEAMLAIRSAVEAEGVRVHRARWDQMATLRRAAELAIAVDASDGGYLAELATWTTRRSDTGDGVPADTIVRPVRRQVPTRVLGVPDDVGLDVPAGGDQHTSYLILFGAGDEPADWLRAGEALSAALLTGAVCGVAGAPMSDLIEVAAARNLIRSLLAGMGHPYLVLRCGTRPVGPPVGHAPRRDPAELIQD